MKKLLIVYQHQIKEKRLALLSLRKKKEDLKTQISELMASFALEQSAPLELHWLSSAYFRNANAQIENLNASISDIDLQILTAQDELRELFTQNKKVEIYGTKLEKQKRIRKIKKELNTQP